MAKLTKRYISHDENASRDEKVLKMREKYGARGYGLFWEIVEYLFSADGKAELNAKVVSLAIGEDVRTVRNFLSDCIEVGAKPSVKTGIMKNNEYSYAT
jgi:hypothetical protein